METAWSSASTGLSVGQLVSEQLCWKAELTVGVCDSGSVWDVSPGTYQFTLTPGADATESNQPNGTDDKRNRHQENTERHWAWGRETETDREEGISAVNISPHEIWTQVHCCNSQFKANTKV